MKLSRFALPLLAPFAILACDDDGGGVSPLTCETLASTGNCWRTAVAEAYACMPEDSPDDGTFNGDRTSCTYAEGQTLAFKTAVPLDPDFDYVWDVTVTNAGTQCARFLSNDATTSITTASGTTSFTTNGSSVTLTCADGSRFSSGNPLGLFQCEGDVDLPGIAWSGSDGPISFSLSASPEGRFGFFNCDE